MAIAEQEELQLRRQLKSGGLSESEELNIRRALKGGEAPERESTTAEKVLGGIEAGTSFLTGALAEIPAGFGGIAKTITSGPEAGQEVIENIREGLTFRPRTETGKEFIAGAGEFLEPVAKALQATEKFLGDAVFDVTGSPTLAAGAATLPTAMLELIGLKGASRLAKSKGLRGLAKAEKQQIKAIQQAAPSAEKLKTISRGVYKEIDDLGASVKPNQYERLVNDIQKGLKEGGFKPKIDDKIAILLDEFNANRGAAMSISDLDDLRTVAQGFAKSVDPKTKGLGVRIIDTVDSFLDGEGILDFPKGTPTNVGKSYRTARKLWGQAKRSEKISELQELAEGNRASFLNGVQTEFKQLIRSHIKGKAPGKYWSRGEIKLMQEVVSGKKVTNIFKNLAKLQITRAGGGSLTPLIFGPGGGIASGIIAGDITTGLATTTVFPLIGEVSNALAVKLTKNNLKFADDIIRAGVDGRKIARAYFENVKKGARSTDELAELLVDPSLDVSKLPKTKFTEEALRKAAELRASKTFAAEQVGIAQLEGEKEGR